MAWFLRRLALGARFSCGDDFVSADRFFAGAGFGGSTITFMGGATERWQMHLSRCERKRPRSKHPRESQRVSQRSCRGERNFLRGKRLGKQICPLAYVGKCSRLITINSVAPTRAGTRRPEVRAFDSWVLTW
jgi:hypothetical protein